MKPTICICCGKSSVKEISSASENPNICASCSNLADQAWLEPETTPRSSREVKKLLVPTLNLTRSPYSWS